MMNVIPFMKNNVFIVFVSFLLFTACVKEETIHFSAENKDWLTDYELGDNFIMLDDNNISHGFSMTENSYYFNRSESGYFFITTHKENTEYHYQNFTSNYGVRFSLSLTAGFAPYGDDIYISLDDIGFDYDLTYKTIARIDCPFGYLSKTMTDTGYENNVTINSTVEYIDFYNINDVRYAGVLHFTFKDYVEQWDNYTVREIFVAKKYGLIKYRLNNGLIFERR